MQPMSAHEQALLSCLGKNGARAEDYTDDRRQDGCTGKGENV